MEKERQINPEDLIPPRRQLPKLIACMTKQSLENMRNKALYGMRAHDMKSIRRIKQPLHECLVLELKEAGYQESSNYLQDLLYDNAELLAEDDIGIVVDLRNRKDYLEYICDKLQIAEREHEKDNPKKESEILLNLALYFKEQGKGLLWLAEKFFLASIAVASRYELDGGRTKCVSKYHYAMFLTDKFPGADPEEAFQLLTLVRDTCIGKNWLLWEDSAEAEKEPANRLFIAAAMKLQKVLIQKSKAIRKSNPGKAERLARLAHRRASDTKLTPLIAEALVEVGICQLLMHNLHNAKNNFEKALTLSLEINNVDLICTVKMHLAAVMQRLGNYDAAVNLLTDMGALAMEHSLRLQLGRALNLLGELHVRSERPELGTMHLHEAFRCFMGTICDTKKKLSTMQSTLPTLNTIFTTETDEVYLEEAEQARLMTAISAGQEKMASYFDLIRKANFCAVERVKCIEWKLERISWTDHRMHHDLVPCSCPKHHRTPLDIMRAIINKRNREHQAIEEENENAEESQSFLAIQESVRDFKELILNEKPSENSEKVVEDEEKDTKQGKGEKKEGNAEEKSEKGEEINRK